jgi:hypothetical protein
VAAGRDAIHGVEQIQTTHNATNSLLCVLSCGSVRPSVYWFVILAHGWPGMRIADERGRGGSTDRAVNFLFGARCSNGADKIFYSFVLIRGGPVCPKFCRFALSLVPFDARGRREVEDANADDDADSDWWR